MKQCKIVINNEVTCNILGLEAKDRRALFKRFEYEVPGAKYLPSVKLGRWDGKISYFSLGGSTYINLLPEILDYLYDQHYDIELDDTRSYNRNFNLTPIVEDTFSNTVWPDKHPMAGQPIVLRDYQVNIVNKFLSNLQSIQEIATGAGKTLVVSALSKKVEPYGRSIVIVPNKSLVTQTEADYRNLGLDVGVYFGERKELGHKHTICTWQSLNIIVKNTKDNVGDINIQDFLHDVVALIVDEVHMAKADVLRTMLSTHASKIPIRWGLTGTVPKEKYASTSLFSCIGPLINTLSANDLQNRGVLAQCHVNIVQLQDNAE
jgi:superfamily II DNA or RNA helicase